MTVTVTAAGAIGNAKARPGAPAQDIADTAAALLAVLADLQRLQSAGGIASVTVTGTTNTVSVAQATQLSALTRFAIGSGARFILADSPANLLSAGASGAEALATAVNLAAGSFSVTAAQASTLAALRGFSVGSAAALNITDTAANLLNASAAVGEAIATSVTLLGASNVVTVAQDKTLSALRGFSLATATSTLTLTDTGANVLAALDDLARLATTAKLTGITFTDSQAPVLSLTATRYLADQAAIAKLPLASLAITGAAAANAGKMQADTHVRTIAIADTSRNIAGAFDALNGDAKITAIAFTDNAPVLALTYQQMTTDTAALAKLSGNYSITVSAAPVTNTLSQNSHVTSYQVADTAAHIAAGLDALEILVKAGKVTGVTPTDAGHLFSITATQLAADADVVAKLSTPLLNVTGVAVANAAATQANAKVVSFNLSDTTANVISAIATLNADSKLASVAFTDAGTPTLALTYNQYLADASLLSKISGGYRLTITDAPVTNTLSTNTHVTGFTVSDTAANISANLNALETLAKAGKLTGVTVKDAGHLVGLTATQYAADTDVVAKMASGVMNVTAATVSGASALQGDAHVGAFTLTDSSANVSAAFAALASDSKLTAVAFTDTSAPTLNLTYSQYTADSFVLSKVTTALNLTVTGAPAANTVLSNSHTTQLTVSDTLANIVSNLDALEAAAKTGKMTGITVTDSGQTATVTPTQYTADKDAIALLKGSFTINQVAQHPTIRIVDDGTGSYTNASATVKAAIQAAVHFFETTFTGNETITLAMGIGEMNGQALAPGVLGEAGPNQLLQMSYAQYKAALAKVAVTPEQLSVVANMAVDPTHGGTIVISTSEAKALGLTSPTAAGVDGSVFMAADPSGSLFAYDPNNRGVQGKYDYIGVLEHEMSHAMGRFFMLQQGVYAGLDLTRYSAAGVHSLSQSGSAYFSVDGGKTSLDAYSTTSDLVDWASSAGNDANTAYAHPGVANLFTHTDVVQMNILGFGV